MAYHKTKVGKALVNARRLMRGADTSRLYRERTEILNALRGVSRCLEARLPDTRKPPLRDPHWIDERAVLRVARDLLSRIDGK